MSMLLVRKEEVRSSPPGRLLKILKAWSCSKDFEGLQHATILSVSGSLRRIVQCLMTGQLVLCTTQSADFCLFNEQFMAAPQQAVCHVSRYAISQDITTSCHCMGQQMDS